MARFVVVISWQGSTTHRFPITFSRRRRSKKWYGRAHPLASDPTHATAQRKDDLMAQKHDLTKIGYLLPAPKHADDTQLRELQQFANGVLQENTGNMIESNGYIRRSFHAVFWMYVVLFVVGVGTAVAATVKGYTASTATETVPALVFAGLSAASFFTVFVTRPLESLERNSIFSSWLIAITNS